MSLLIATLAAAIGYLLGSISFARLIAQWAAPQRHIGRIELAVPGSMARLESTAISATAVRVHVGPRYGALTAASDMLKVAIPALAFKLWQPEMPYSLILAAAGTVGHIWPLYHRFKGGRGMSPTLGGFLVVDWLGVLLTNLVALLTGMALRNLMIVMAGGFALMIPWVWLRTQDTAKLIYVAFMNVLYWVAMLPELRQYVRLRKEGRLSSLSEVAEFMDMGSMFRVAQRFSLPCLMARLRADGRNAE